MSSIDEPTWSICRRAVWMFVQDSKNLAVVNDLLNRQEHHDVHIASGKCIILLLMAINTLEKSRLEDAMIEFKRLELHFGAKMTGGWIGAFKRKLFLSADTDLEDYERKIMLADVTMCIACLTMTVHRDDPSMGTLAQVIFSLRRAWKLYQKCYFAVLGIYRNVYDLDLDQNTPKWPPVLKRRKSVNLTPPSNIGSRMLRSATTSFETLRTNSLSNIMPQDVVRLMAAVSVGYGAFNLFVSLLPPTIASVVGMLGFNGNRQTGLDALAFAKNGPDVHAPLAWGILSWYRMVVNTDYLFDGPQSRENEVYVKESEQLVINPPEEFRNSTLLQYFTGRSCYLKGDLDGSIRAYEIESTIVEYCLVNMEAMYLHELGFMYIMRLDWKIACKEFASVAEDFIWMRPYHYFMAMMCASAAGDEDTAERMLRRTDEAVNNRWTAAERNMVGKFVVDGKRRVAKALRTTTDDNCYGGSKLSRLIVYEALYVKYGVAKWPVDALHAVIADCCETDDDDDDTIRYTKKFLTIVCRKALGFIDGHFRLLIEIVQSMERDKRRDHLYAYSLYELAAEQIGRNETIEDGKRTIQKLNGLKEPYHFQQFYELRCAALQAFVLKLNVS